LKDEKELEEDDRWNPEDNQDGSFMMSYKSWREIFTTLYACPRLDGWSALLIRGEWTPESAGGIPKGMDDEAIKKWLTNPKYLINVKMDTTAIIRVCQSDGRLCKDSEYPFNGTV